MSNVDTLCDAVRSRSVVELTYDNQIRVVNPHVVWIKQDDERTVFCSCWQVGGYSSRGKPPLWARLKVAEITSCKITSETFSAAQPDFNNYAHDNIICSL